MLQKLRQVYENFEQTLVEGNYRSGQHSIWSRILGKNEDLPETTEIAVGATMLGTSRTWGSRLLWAGAVAWLSVHFLAWAALAVGAVGAGVLANEYVHCRRARNEVITEVNFAGQRVEGTRADLCRLHMAQVRIMNIANSFHGGETTHDAVQQIIDSVREESKRVKVLSIERYDPDKTTYDFSEPRIHLVNDRHKPERAERPAVNSAPGLKEAWEKSQLTEDEVVDRLAALERALPPAMQEKLAKKRAQAPGN